MSLPPLEISRITTADLPDIVVLRRKAYRTSGPATRAIYRGVSDADYDADSRTVLEAGLANSHEVLLKATRGQELIAFASWILPHEEEEVHSAPVAGKIVLPPGTDEALYLDFFPKLGEFKKTIKELHYRLNSLGTDPAFERTGAGTALAKWGIERAEVEGSPVHLNASLAGEALYLRLGFVPNAPRIASTLDPVCSYLPMVRRSSTAAPSSTNP